MTNNVEIKTVTPNKILMVVIALVLVAVSALLCIVKGINFNTEFGGGASISVKFPAELTAADVDKAVNAVKANSSAQIISVQSYSTDSVLIRTAPVEDPVKLQEAVTSALSLGKEAVKAANTDRYVDKDALISIAYSLLIAGAIVLVYFALRFGVLSAVGTLFGMIVTAAVWLLPYALFSVFDYKAFTVLAVGIAVFVVENALVYGKKIRKAADLNLAPALKPVLLITALGIVSCLILGIVANLWSITLPLCFILVGAAFSALYASGAFVLMFKK